MTHTSIFQMSGASGIQKFGMFEKLQCTGRESSFTLELNDVKHIPNIEKWFKRKFRKIQCPTKNLVDACL